LEKKKKQQQQTDRKLRQNSLWILGGVVMIDEGDVFQHLVGCHVRGNAYIESRTKALGSVIGGRSACKAWVKGDKLHGIGGGE
jgi:hypothetical protein